MSNVPTNLKYTSDHEWLNAEDKNCFIIGITDHAQDSLGDVTFVELPEVGKTFSKGDVFGVVESVKAASDLFMPVGGQIQEINENLSDSPENLNQNPYGDGWLVKVKPDSENDLDNLLSPEQYKQAIG